MCSLHIVSSVGVLRTAFAFVALRSIGIQACYRWAFIFTPGHLGSSSFALAVLLRCCGAGIFTSSLSPPLYVHALVPISFQVRVSTFISASFPVTLAIFDGYLFVRDMAHNAYEGLRAHPPITSERSCLKIGSRFHESCSEEATPQCLSTSRLPRIQEIINKPAAISRRQVSYVNWAKSARILR
jgi:hypothetical protein